MWLKIKQEGLCRFWSMFPLTRATHFGIIFLRHSHMLITFDTGWLLRKNLELGLFPLHRRRPTIAGVSCLIALGLRPPIQIGGVFFETLFLAVFKPKGKTILRWGPLRKDTKLRWCEDWAPSKSLASKFATMSWRHLWHGQSRA